MILISTQTASSSASLQWTGTGNNYYLSCQNMVNAAAGHTLYIEFGEGSTPTWEQANYNNYWGTPASAVSGGTGIILAYGNSAAPGASAEVHLFSLSSSSVEKMATGTWMEFDNDDSVFYGGTIGGYYTGDTGAITAVRVIVGTGASGNITSGTCSLYGMN